MSDQADQAILAALAPRLLHLQTLVETLLDSQPDRRTDPLVTEQLGQLPTDTKRTLQDKLMVFVEAAHNPRDREERERAQCAINWLPIISVPNDIHAEISERLATVMLDQTAHPDIRSTAAYSLESSAVDLSEQLYQVALTDTDAGVRQNAAASLGYQTNPSSQIDQLTALSIATPADPNQTRALEALAEAVKYIHVRPRDITSRASVIFTLEYSASDLLPLIFNQRLSPVLRTIAKGTLVLTVENHLELTVP